MQLLEKAANNYTLPPQAACGDDIAKLKYFRGFAIHADGTGGCTPCHPNNGSTAIACSIHLRSLKGAAYAA